MANATPGPWTISRRNDAEAPYSIISGADTGRAYAIAMCPRYRSDEWADDARLIAAAPDLLEFAEVTLGYAIGIGSVSLERMARAAIAKATGAQP